MQMRMTTRTRTNCKSGFTLLEITVLLVVIGLLAVVAIPNFVKAREQGQFKSIVNNLRVTKDSKDQWALQNKERNGSSPVATDLAPHMKNNTFPPTKVVGETYNINPVGTAATATTPLKLGTYNAASNVSIP